MFIRRKKNKSGSISVYLLKKEGRKQLLIKSFGSGKTEQEILRLEDKAYKELERISRQSQLDFNYEQDDQYLSFLKNNINHIQPIGTELVLNKIFDDIGFNQISDTLFRHLILSRVICPGSKLKMIDYLSRYQHIYYDVSKVYRYMDKLHDSYKELLQRISYKHTLGLFNGHLSVVFYDVTTLYFEASQEDELRKIGYSKDGKSHNPQIVLGLLVSKGGYPLAFEMHQGNKYEGHTFIPILEKFKSTFELNNLIVIADSGLMSNSNIKQLKENNYNFIIGARIKNESLEIKQKILSYNWGDKIKVKEIDLNEQTRLIVSYSQKRAKKDANNRDKGIERLKVKIKSGKLSKANINNRGYNKFLKIEGQALIKLDLTKQDEDKKWDGLKGYVTNTDLSTSEIIENYKELWQIEKAFRMSKTDLKVRPIYHRKAKRIESHLIISFCSYKVYKELERLLKIKNLDYSPEKAIDILKSIYAMQTILPVSKKNAEIIMVNNFEQKEILDAFDIKY